MPDSELALTAVPSEKEGYQRHVASVLWRQGVHKLRKYIEKMIEAWRIVRPYVISGVTFGKDGVLALLRQLHALSETPTAKATACWLVGLVQCMLKFAVIPNKSVNAEVDMTLFYGLVR